MLNLRTAGTSEEPFFCLADICKALELQVQNTKKRLNKDGVYSIKLTDSLGREQQALFINEQNLYKTIFQSRKKEAEMFVDWITGEVLPTIRKTGRFEVWLENSKMLLELAKAESAFSVFFTYLNDREEAERLGERFESLRDKCLSDAIRQEMND